MYFGISSLKTVFLLRDNIRKHLPHLKPSLHEKFGNSKLFFFYTSYVMESHLLAQLSSIVLNFLAFRVILGPPRCTSQKQYLHIQSLSVCHFYQMQDIIDHNYLWAIDKADRSCMYWRFENKSRPDKFQEIFFTDSWYLLQHSSLMNPKALN